MFTIKPAVKELRGYLAQHITLMPLIGSLSTHVVTVFYISRVLDPVLHANVYANPRQVLFKNVRKQKGFW